MSGKIYKVLVFVLSLLLFLGLIWLARTVSQKEIVDFIARGGIWAPLLYIVIQILGQVFAPISTSVLFVASFVMFGKVAIVYSILVWLISSTINFSIARRLGKPVLKFFLGEGGISQVENIAKRLNNRKLYLLRIVTFFISDFASYAFGFTNMSYIDFLFATVLSIIPWSLIMWVIIRENENILITTIKVFAVMIPFALLSYIFIREKKGKTN